MQIMTNEESQETVYQSMYLLFVCLLYVCLSVVSWYLLHMTGNIPCFITFIQLEHNLVAKHCENEL